MVRRLVKNQRVDGFQQHLRQRLPRFLAAGKYTDGLEYIVPAKEECSKQRSNLRLSSRRGVPAWFSPTRCGGCTLIVKKLRARYRFKRFEHRKLRLQCFGLMLRIIADA